MLSAFKGPHASELAHIVGSGRNVRDEWMRICADLAKNIG